MNWPTVLSTSIASACLVLGAIHFVIWLKIRTFRASLGFSVLAFGVAAFALSSLAMMRSDTPERFLAALWWTNLSVFVTVAGLVAFVSAYFRTARPWLAHLTWVSRFVTVVVNLTREPSFAYDRIIAVQPVTLLGERVYVADGVTSPWYWFGQLTLALAFVFPLDASYRLWKSGDLVERRRALAIGVPASMFVLVAWLYSALTFREVVDLPHLEFVPFLGLMLAMGYKLSADVIRAARLSGELQVSEAALRASEQRMRVAAESARVAERSARELSGRLITAQEDERRRLARDLHDDLSQRLSVLSVELEIFGRDQPDAPRDRVERLAATVREIAAQVHGLSYQLHPAKLDQLGLETAARSWCREVTQQTGVHVEFVAFEIPDDLAPDIALCAYRVIQEALRNTVRHSQADAAFVELRGEDGALRLRVSDSGRGFDVGQARGAGGLGLLSMRERAQLVHGSLEVESRPGDGTRLKATIPFRAHPPDAEAAGHDTVVTTATPGAR